MDSIQPVNRVTSVTTTNRRIIHFFNLNKEIHLTETWIRNHDISLYIKPRPTEQVRESVNFVIVNHAVGVDADFNASKWNITALHFVRKQS